MRFRAAVSEAEFCQPFNLIAIIKIVEFNNFVRFIGLELKERFNRELAYERCYPESSG